MSLIYEKRDIQRMFDVREKTLYRWVKAGKFPAPALPGRWDKHTIDMWWADICGHSRTSADITPKTIRHGDLRL